MKRLLVAALLFAVLAVLGNGIASARTFIVGVILVGTNRRGHQKNFTVANYLAKQLGKEGFIEAKVVVAKTMNEMASLLRDSKVDLHFDSYARALALSGLSGSKPFLRRWKRGATEYHGVLFVRADSAINRIEDLRGKTFAMEEEFSSVGHLLPKFMLLEKGLKLMPVQRMTPDSVGYNFAYWDENTMLWVLKGKVFAGAMDSQTYAELSKKQGDVLKVLGNTPSVPRHIVSARTRLPQDLLMRVKEILVQMDQSEEGKKALFQFERTAKFDELTEQNTALMQKMWKLIKSS